MLLEHTRKLTGSPMHQHYCEQRHSSERLYTGDPDSPKSLWYWGTVKPIMRGDLTVSPRRRVLA